jgi:PhzF family phenazine biosynthesis protein
MSSMMEMNIINCFCIKETGSGNPAAIVRNFTQDENEKQALAKRLNLPVTVFLSEIIDGTYNIEYFYPETEMSLCLHGTIGAAYIISREKNLVELTFITKDKKSLKTRIVENAIQVHMSSQSTPSISIDKLKICKMLNLKNDDEIDLELPFLVSSVGSPKLLVPLKTMELLGSLKPNFDLIAEWSIVNAINGFYVYTKYVNSDDFNFYARGFNPKGGHPEDAATGVAAAALSLALKKDIVVGQGIFLNRPSKIIVSYENQNNIWVGGKAQESIRDEDIFFFSKNGFKHVI